MSDTKTSVQAQFGQTAENYRHSVVHAQGHELQWLADQLRALPDAVVLDVGCGAGHTSAAVAVAVREVVALDLTAAMLDQVQILASERGLTNIRTQQGDVEDIPFADGMFDVVVTRYSAHHWPNPAKALAEIARVLKPGGRFVLIDIVSYDSPADDTFLQAIELLRDLSHVRDHKVTEWLDLLARAGFRAQVQSQWPLPLDFDAWVKRMAVPANRVTMIRHLFDEAAESTRALLNYTGTAFDLQTALFDATR